MAYLRTLKTGLHLNDNDDDDDDDDNDDVVDNDIDDPILIIVWTSTGRTRKMLMVVIGKWGVPSTIQ